MRWIGIDPGFDGALAVIESDGSLVWVCDTPTLTVQSGKKTRRAYDLPAMVRAVERARTGTVRAIIEAVHAMPKQGVRSMWTMGYGSGVWEGLLTAYLIPWERIRPEAWKRVMLAGMGKGKDAAILRAHQVFPAAVLRRKRDHGRADALLLAEYLRRIAGTTMKDAPEAGDPRVTYVE